jgi:hypothetical protein
MTNPSQAVPHSPFEMLTWGCLFAVVGVTIIDSSSAVELGAALALLAVAIGCLVWSNQIHRQRPDLLAARAPVEVLWFLVIGALVLAALAVTDSSLSARVIDGLIAVGLLAAVVAERTRPVPMKQEPLTGGLGPLDFSDPVRRNRFIWIQRAGVLVIWLGFLVGGVIFGNAAAQEFVVLVPIIWLCVFELPLRVAKKRKLGYYALDEK